MTATTETVWTADEQALLGTLADMVVPRDEPMPSATDVDVHTAGVDAVAALRPDLVEPVRALLDRVRERAPQDLAELMADHPAEFRALAELVAGAYFLEPRVAGLLGYRARRALPLGDLAQQSNELVDLVAPVVARGNRWRTTDGDGVQS
ncbi:hypothetical protein [Pseudonocardia acidicola]|uniref:Uncharacterized protein n=1 Tax=Pseudonocardia acidicola TaxID=2724939 RepID=A0ABX1SMI9_9PSEU|nr:hypothetical protein [Pseudonocardia acidicola]NMI01749.1 hypothetical protein [Pseudonocardia acidicola]